MLNHVGDSRHTQNVQFNKVIGENEKNCVLFYEKSYGLFGQPNSNSHPIPYPYNHYIFNTFLMSNTACGLMHSSIGMASQFITGEVLAIGLPHGASDCLCPIYHQLQDPYCQPGSESSNSKISSLALLHHSWCRILLSPVIWKQELKWPLRYEMFIEDQ